jgi:hypothetical protein
MMALAPRVVRDRAVTLEGRVLCAAAEGRRLVMNQGNFSHSRKLTYRVVLLQQNLQRQSHVALAFNFVRRMLAKRYLQPAVWTGLTEKVVLVKADVTPSGLIA